MTATPPAPFTPRARPIHWPACYRIIPSRFPPIHLFERVADPADLEAIFVVEALTNTRLRDEVGDLALVPPAERVSGPGSSWIMAPFTHVSAPGGRFSTPFFGAYYTARERSTAVAETVYHRQRFLSATSEPPTEIDMRVLRATLRADLHDVRGLRASHPELYHLTDYTASQAFATMLREGESKGIAYDSVREAGGECAAVFTPKAISNCRQAAHLTYVWDGTRIVSVYEKSGLRTL
jgi:RES domain-containing protein